MACAGSSTLGKEMAIVRRLEPQQLSLEATHTETECTYSIVRGRDGTTYLRKPRYGGRRPDIVFHERGVHRSNFLVIELKRNGRPGAVSADVRKIEDYWFAPPLLYRFGAAINVRTDGRNDIVVLRDPNPRARRASSRRRRVTPPLSCGDRPAVPRSSSAVQVGSA